MNTVDLPQGPIDYRVAGPADSAQPPVVFVHAFLIGGSVWSEVADRLADHGIRSYAPDWPLGAHRKPLHADADRSPRGLARHLLDFLEVLDLHEVTLVGNDTGGALVQYAIVEDPTRIGRVVLTNCDAFDSFPPSPFKIIFGLLAGTVRMAINLQPMRLRAFRHSPLGFGLLANSLDPQQSRSWIEPALADRRIRTDAVGFLRAVDPAELLAVSSRLRDYPGLVRIVWGMDDTAFRPELGRRLQAAFGDAEFVEVLGAKTFVQLDAPELLADQIAELTAHQVDPQP